MGFATVSVAAIGVPPMARAHEDIPTLRSVASALGLVGGTPTSARETRAIPGTRANRVSGIRAAAIGPARSVSRLVSVS
jgi:hypothetical protein